MNKQRRDGVKQKAQDRKVKDDSYLEFMAQLRALSPEDRKYMAGLDKHVAKYIAAKRRKGEEID